MKKAIYYFSGTGNSLRAARLIASELGGAEEGGRRGPGGDGGREGAGNAGGSGGPAAETGGSHEV